MISIERYAVPYKEKSIVARPPLISKREEKEKFMDDYLKALPNYSGQSVILTSKTTCSDDLRRMRVRGSKPGKDKGRTDIDVLARGKAIFRDGVCVKIAKNDGFGKFDQHMFNDKHLVIGLQELSDAIKYKPTLDRAIRRAKLNIDNCTINRMYATKNMNGNLVEYTKRLMPVKSVHTLHSRAVASNEILDCTNRLLRQVLLFKGIGFGNVLQDLRESNMKPVTYNVNTTIEYDESGKNDIRFIRAFRVHSVTVKKTFINKVNNGGIEENEYKMFFSSDCCKSLSVWLKSLKEDMFAEPELS